MTDLNLVLDYLQRLPAYPFDSSVDPDFVDELLIDFSHIDVLEQIKAFRWYHNGDPAAHTKNLRLAIRRWLSMAIVRTPEPF